MKLILILFKKERLHNYKIYKNNCKIDVFCVEIDEWYDDILQEIKTCNTNFCRNSDMFIYNDFWEVFIFLHTIYIR